MMAKQRGQPWIPVEHRVGGYLDRALSVIAPRSAWARTQARFKLSAYRAADSSRLKRDRPPGAGSADWNAPPWTIEKIRDASRDAERNNPVVAALLNCLVENVAGGPFTPQATTGDSEWNSEAEDRFDRWATRWCDIRGGLTLQDKVRMAVRTVARDGDMGVILTQGGTLQEVEAECICSPTDPANKAKKGNTIVNGVEINAAGRPQRYWVAPYSAGGSYVSSAKAEPIEAGYFLHLYRPDRFSQTRGVPAAAPVLDRLELLDRYLEAELVAAQVQACFGVAITQEAAAEQMYGRTTEEVNAVGKKQAIEELEPGMILHLNPNEGITPMVPGHPPAQFEPYVQAVLKEVCNAFGFRLEVLDSTLANYSSIRAGLLQCYRTFRSWQYWLEDHLLRTVWRWKVSQFIKYGGPEDGEKALRKPSEGREWDHAWVKPGWEWVDPQKEAWARAQSVAMGVSTLAEECASVGRDWEDVMTQRAREIAKAIELGAKMKVDWHELVRPDAVKVQPITEQV
jgi:lambda family phage portal protein